MQITNLSISFSKVKSAKLIPSKEYSLTTEDVIIYTIYLPNFINIKNYLSNYLNAKEIKKAQQFYKEKDKNKFIIYRSILKFILASHTKLDVRAIDFDYHYNKKPFLASHPFLHFNISHSEDFAAIAISNKKVGLDIEFMHEHFNFTNVLEDVFVDNEISAIQEANNKKHAFYTSWTRKEAFVKALGKGIDEDFKFIPCLDGHHTLNNTISNKNEIWQLYSFELADNYLGAIAFEGLSKISKTLKLYSIPNTIQELVSILKK